MFVLQVHRRQAQVLATKASCGCDRYRRREQDEDSALLYAHHKLSGVHREAQQKIGARFPVEEDI